MRTLSNLGLTLDRHIIITILFLLLHYVAVLADKKNHASSECAKVLEANPETKRAHTILNEVGDEYLLGPCNADKWFVIELCIEIRPTQIQIGNFELFSSIFKDFTVSLSDVYPATDWRVIGEFAANNTRTLQTFDLNSQIGFGKFIRVDLHSHHGSEYYCIISETKVYGITMQEEYINESEKVDPDNSSEPSNDSFEIDPNITIINTTFVSPIRNETKTRPRLAPKTSAYKVYKKIMISSVRVVNSSRIDSAPSIDNTTTKLPIVKNQDKTTPPPSAQPLSTLSPANKSNQPVKGSIFVDLSNKYKSLEASLSQLRVHYEDIGRRLNETESKLDKSTSFLKSNFQFVVIVVKIFFVYKLMMNLM